MKIKRSYTLCAMTLALSLVCDVTWAESDINSVLSQTGAQAARDRGLTGRNVSVAVIDQGFDLTHRDIIRSNLVTRNFQGGGSVTWGSHGTAMVGIIAANVNGLGTVGLAPQVRLILAQAGSGGSVHSLTTQAVARSLDWASAQGAAVVNMSFGAPYTAADISVIKRNFNTGIYFVKNLPMVVNPNDYKLATDRGSILVMSAGNQGLSYSEFPAQLVSRVDQNGRLLLSGRAIVVGAVNSNNEIADFSNRAGHICQSSSGTRCFDTHLTKDFYVVAPGVNVISSLANQVSAVPHSTSLVSGTSPAAAVVTGGMALLKQAWPQLRPEQLVQLVLSTTRDLGAPGVDNVYGRGLVDFDKATGPQGPVVLAPKTQNLGGGVVVKSSPARVLVSGSITQSLKSSSVLKNTQVIDQYQRNYSWDISQSIMPSPAVVDPLSPYLIFSSHMVREAQIHDWKISISTGDHVTAVNLRPRHGHGGFIFELGSQSQSQGFLDNHAQGVMSIKNSSTTWHFLGYQLPITDHSQFTARFGQGRTVVATNSDSMMQITDPVMSQTFTLGITRDKWLSHKDQVQFGFGSGMKITRGRAEITAVTGYKFDDTSGDHVQARPVITQESIDLRSRQNPHLYFTYMMPVNDDSQLSVNLTANASNHRLGVKYNMRF